MKDPIDIIYENPELKLFFSEFIKNNKSNNAPYHNLWHTLCMVKTCNDAANHSTLKSEEKTDLLIAALIHDMNHSMGKKPDVENVKNAISSGWKLYKDCGMFGAKEDDPKGFIESYFNYNSRVARIIRATEYPYVIDGDKLDEQQQIIRDADLLQSFEPTWFSHTIMGLSKEMNIDLKDFLPNAKCFIDSAVFHTEWGKKIYEEKKPFLLERMEKLIEMI